MKLLAGVVLTAVALVLLVAGAWRLSRSRTTQLFGDLVTNVATSDSLVALTFDDGPAVPHTDSVLALLDRHNVKATFFVTGAALERNPALARRVVTHGHELGNHSYSHQRMVLMSPSTIRREIETTDSLIRDAGYAGPVHFRPPYARRLVGLPWYLWRTGRTTVLWTLEPDSRFTSANEMTDHVLRNTQPGTIILLHVDLASRVEERRSLAQIIDGLRYAGYEFVTVSQLMAAGRT